MFSKFCFRDEPIRYGSGIRRDVDGGQQNTNDAQNLNKPYPYFGTDAEKIRATPVPPHADAPHKPLIVGISLAVFLIYFCILRESNDIDEQLGADLHDHFGYEASQLKKTYDYNIKHQLPTQEIVSRLREIGAPVPPGA